MEGRDDRGDMRRVGEDREIWKGEIYEERG